MELTLAKYDVSKVKSEYLAQAGIRYAMNQIRLDTKDPQSSATDTVYYCAIPQDEEYLPEKIFKNHQLESGYFDIVYRQRDPSRIDSESKKYYGLQDEERKVNINSLIAPQNLKVFSSLLTLLGFDSQIAETISGSVKDWIDSDNVVSNDPYGAEDDYYMSLDNPYHCKNQPLDSLEELLLVKGMTREIFTAIKDYLTIFPKQGGGLRINFETASETVLKALARSGTGAATNTNVFDADSLVEKISRYQQGSDGVRYTADDVLVDMNQLSLSLSETAVFQVMNQFRTMRSDYLRIRAKGVEKERKIKTVFEVVVFRDNLTILSSSIQ